MIGDDPHAAATAPVTPVRAALGDVGFATERDAAGTAVTRLGVELGGIDEGGHTPILRNPTIAKTPQN